MSWEYPLCPCSVNFKQYFHSLRLEVVFFSDFKLNTAEKCKLGNIFFFSHAFAVFTVFFFQTSLGVLRFVAPALYETLSFSAVLKLTEKRRNIVCNPIYRFVYLFTITFKFVFGEGGWGDGREHDSGRRRVSVFSTLA